MSNLAQYGHTPGLKLDGVLVLADAETLRDKAANKYVGNTIKRQLACTDLIVLNKRDLVSTEHLRKTHDWLSENFHAAKIIESTFGDVPLDILLGNVRPEEERPQAIGHHHHETYGTWHFQRSEPASERAMVDFVLGLPSFVIRAKGLVQLDTGTARTIQVVGERKEIDATDKSVDGVSLIAIGLEDEFKSETLDELASRCFAS